MFIALNCDSKLHFILKGTERHYEIKEIIINNNELQESIYYSFLEDLGLFFFLFFLTDYGIFTPFSCSYF